MLLVAQSGLFQSMFQDGNENENTDRNTNKDARGRGSKVSWLLQEQTVCICVTDSQQSQKSLITVIELKDDDVWTLARFIQFLYRPSYEVREERVYDSETRRHVCLRDVVEGCSVPHDAFDRQLDRQRTRVQIHCMAIAFADKYQIPLLLRYAIQEIMKEFGGWAVDGQIRGRFWSCFEDIGQERLTRHQCLQDAFACLAIRLFPDVKDERLRQ